MNTTPCPLCGYEATGPGCPHCELTTTDPSLAKPAADPVTSIIDGFRAVPTGLYLMLTTRGVKRLMVPPVLITGLLFCWFLYIVLSFVWNLVDAIQLDDPSQLEIETEWLRSAAEWLMAGKIAAWAAQISSTILALIAGMFLMWWVGSILYEAIAGPFLDEIQGRFEKKWFGKNPRDEIERPTKLPTSRCATLSVIAGVPAFGMLVLWWVTSGLVAWFFLFMVPVPFFALGVLIREYGTWLWWVVRVEGRTLVVSLKASALAFLFLIPAGFLKLVVPVFGPILFVLLAGFATSITLLDIPFSRRQWPLALRMRFLIRNLFPMMAFGVVSALLFTVPLIGPLLMVPSASIGGLWLICRLDKNHVRPAGNKIERGV